MLVCVMLLSVTVIALPLHVTVIVAMLRYHYAMPYLCMLLLCHVLTMPCSCLTRLLLYHALPCYLHNHAMLGQIILLTCHVTFMPCHAMHTMLHSCLTHVIA